MIDAIDRVLGMLDRALAWAGSLLLALLVLLVGAQVALRYFTAQSILWAGEAATLMFMWMVFVGAPVLHRRAGHIVVSVVSDRLRGRAAVAARVLVSVGVIAFCGFAVVQVAAIWTILEATSTAVLDLPNTVHAAGLVAGLAVIALQETVNLARGLGRSRIPGSQAM